MKILSKSALITTLSLAIANMAYATVDPEQLIEQQGVLVHNEDFTSHSGNWVIEKTNQTQVSIANGAMSIDDGAGVTVWFQHEITTPSIIEFNGTVVVNDGPNDRGTDLNFFWMAQDPQNTDFFAKSEWRAGDMRKYDNMRLYYIGYGANDNSTTRFRRYPGDGSRPLLPEYDVTDTEFMNTPNKMTNIKIVNLDDKVLVFSNDKRLYEINDKNQFKNGMFGFRTWKSHIKIDDFKVYNLTKN